MSTIYQVLASDPEFGEITLNDWLNTEATPGEMLDFACLVMNVVYRSEEITEAEKEEVITLAIKTKGLSNAIFRRVLMGAFGKSSWDIFIRDRQ